MTPQKLDEGQERRLGLLAPNFRAAAILQDVEPPNLTMNFAGNDKIPVGDMQRLVLHADANHATKEYFSPFNTLESSTAGFWEANARLSFEDDEHNYEFAA